MAELPVITQRRAGLRRVLLLLPVLLLAGSIVLLAAAPFSWDAGAVLELQPWMPPFIGCCMAFAGIAISLFAIRVVAARTRGDFELLPIQLAFGVFMFIAGAALQLTFASQIGSTATYERALDPNGEPEVSPAMFMFGTAVLAGMTLAWVWAAAYIYVNAITNLQPNAISMRRPGEVDGIGELLKENNRP